MIAKGNVLDFTKRRKKVQTTTTELEAPAPVVDITERRQEMISQERRVVKRTILNEFVGACAVVPKFGLLKVAIHDISKQGMAFDIDGEFGAFRTGEEVALRVYLNRQTYFPFVVKIQNVRTLHSEGVHRHGAFFVKGAINDMALYHFVRFIETVSASLETDAGDVMVSNLSRK